MLEKLFRLREKGTTVGTEILAGLVTFMTLSYILFVQPAVLGAPPSGMPAESVFFATCVASALACFLMGLLANLPIGLAPAMGHNFFFAFMVCQVPLLRGFGFSWQAALAANFCAGAVFLLVSGLGFREAIMNAIPDSLKYAIAVGIGLLIALLGLEWGGLVVDHPQLYVALGDLGHPVTLLTLFGLTVTAILYCLGLKGAILIGIVVTAGTGLAAQAVFPALATPHPLVQPPTRVLALPQKPFEAALQLDFSLLFSRPFVDVVTVLFIFLFLDLFDTIGTLVGVSERGGLLADGKLPRARQALFSDAAGTITGTLLGTSTITSYVESAAGVSSGGRTGLTAIVIGVLFLASLFFFPLVQVVGSGVPVTVEEPAGVVVGTPGTLAGVETRDVPPADAQAEEPVVTEIAEAKYKHVVLRRVTTWYPVIAPVLILVGAMMITSVTKIKWSDPTEAIPAFLTLIIMPTAFNITEGIAWGFIAFAVLKLATGQGRQPHWLLYLFALLFVLRYVFLTA